MSKADPERLTARRTGRPRFLPNHEQPTPRSICLMDSYISKGFGDFGKWLAKAVTRFLPAEGTITKLPPPPHHIQLSPNHSMHDLSGASQLIDSVSSELLRHFQNTKTAVFFNILDRQHLEKLKQTILEACGTERSPDHCVRLLKIPG